MSQLGYNINEFQVSTFWLVMSAGSGRQEESWSFVIHLGANGEGRFTGGLSTKTTENMPLWVLLDAPTATTRTWGPV